MITTVNPFVDNNVAAMCNHIADRFFGVDSFAWLKYRSEQRLYSTRD